MGSLTEVFQHIDALIMDYLNRTGMVSVAQKFQYEKNLGNYDERNGTTLEDLYFHYIRNTKISIIDAEDTGYDHHEMTQPTEVKLTKAANISNLPAEIRDMLLLYIPKKENFLLRSVNSVWNIAVSESLRRRWKTPILLRSDQHAELFLNTFKHSIRGSKNIFTAYNFRTTQVNVIRILGMVGPGVTIGRFSNLLASNETILFECLLKTPNIQRLTLSRNSTLIMSEYMKLMKFPCLRYLRILDPKNHIRIFNYIELESLQNWFQLAPNLQEFKTNFELQLKDSSAEFDQILQLHASLQLAEFMYLKIFVSGAKQGSKKMVKLFIEGYNSGNNEDNSHLMALHADSIQNLTLLLIADAKMDLSLPVLPNVTKLRLHSECDYRMRWSEIVFCPIESKSFPALKHVSLLFKSGLCLNHFINGASFETVESLQLRVFSLNLDQIGQLHITFPGITCLMLCTKQISKRDIDYITKYMTNLTTLHFVEEKYSREWSMSIFEFKQISGHGNYSIFEWSLSKLTELKRLTFECEKSIRGVVFDLVSLTHKKIIQPLESLSIITTATNIDQEFGLFNSLKDLRWHKEINFFVQSERNDYDWDW